ncbi:MAG: RNA-protein complex protein Nop10 [Nanoarchaeota archaeon]
MKTIMKCQKCHKYTMNDTCECSGKTLTPKPAKFSIEDKYAQYRRKAKLEIFKGEGLL